MNLYFDNAATTHISENALREYIRTSEDFFANPSSVHKPGLKAHKKLDEEREKIESLLKVKSSSIVFTSGATESIASVISSLLFTTPGKIIISAIEHEAVSSWLPLLKQYGWECKELKARNGIISRDDLIAELTPDTKFIGIMAVNNVTGAIEPIKELVQCVRDYEKTINRKIFFFADSVQALGKIEYDLISLDIDGASFSAHKINGPRGIGMLYLKNPSSFRPLSTGGGQERGKRGGTENLPAIAAFRVAMEEWLTDQKKKNETVSEYKLMTINALKELGLEILSPEISSPYILSFASTLPSEVFTRMLSDKGVYASAGSACSNNTKGESEKILLRMGRKPNEAKNAVRLSFSNSTTKEDVEALISILKEIVNGK